MTNEWWLINLLSLLSISGFAIILAVRLNIHVRHAFLPATVLIMLALFVGGLANRLPEIFFVIFWSGLLLLTLIFALARYRRMMSQLPDINFSAMALFCFWILSSVWLADYKFLGYDEFTHWGLIAKFLIENNAFPDINSHIAFMQYPPGTAVIQYFFGKYSNSLEQSILFGHLTLFFSCGLYLTSASKTSLGRISILVWFLLSTYILRYDISFIFVDAMLGAFLGTILFTAAWAISTDEPDRRAKLIWLIVPAVAYMPLIKHVGLVIGLSAATAMIAVHLIWMVRERRSRPNLTSQNLIIPGLACLVAAVIFSYWLWKVHYQSLGIVDTYQSAITLSNALEFLFHPTDPTHIELWRTFIKRMAGGVGIGTIILIAWSIFYLTRVNKKYLAEMSILSVMTLLGLVGYITLLLISYAFFFTGDERIHMASFERYARSYQLGWFALLIAMPSIPYLLNLFLSKRTITVIFIIGMVALAVHPLARKSLFLKTHVNQASHDYQMRQEIADLAQALTATLLPEKRAYFFDVSGDGLSWYMLRYETNGATQINSCWAAPPILADGTIGERNAGCPRDLANILTSYDYVIIRNPDNVFIQENQEVLSPGTTIESMMIYTLTRQPDGSPKLQKVNSQ